MVSTHLQSWFDLAPLLCTRSVFAGCRQHPDIGIRQHGSGHFRKALERAAFDQVAYSKVGAQENRPGQAHTRPPDWAVLSALGT